MSTATIRLDSTAHSVVVVCSACPWRTMVADRAAGWAAGAAHERRTHGTARGNAAKAAQAAERRAKAT